jgi:biotin carboxylase
VFGIEPIADVVFVVRPSPYATPRVPMLRELGSVVELAGDEHEDVRRLRSAGIDGIVTFSEAMLPTTARLAEALNLPHHDSRTVRLLTDKFAQRERLRAAGIDPVRVSVVSGRSTLDRAVANLRFPLVVKPRQGHSSEHTYLIADPAAVAPLLTDVWRAAGSEVEFVLEELLVGRDNTPFGDYVSVESLVVGGYVRHLAVTGKYPLCPPFRERGQFAPCGLNDDERCAVEDLAGRALRALGIRLGITHTEIKLTKKGPRVIEVNGRIGGHVAELYLRACDVDLVTVAGSVALGNAPDVVLPPPDRIYFQHNNLAPREPCELHEVRYVDEIVQHEAIDQYVPYVRTGESLPGGVGTRHLDLITGSADTYQAMFDILDDVLSALTFVVAFAGERTELTARELLAA